MMDHVQQHRFMTDVKKYLGQLDERDLRKKVRRYFNQERGSWDFNKRLKELGKVLEVPGTRSYSHFTHSRTIPSETKLYRARVIQQLEEICSVDDVLNPPNDLTSAGRLNRKGNSLLYTALSPATAAHEIRVEPGMLISMASFRTVLDIPCTDLTQGTYGNQLPMRLQARAEIIMDFLERLISQRDKPSHMPDYGETEFIVDSLFKGPPELSSGWFYPSYADPSGVGENICFRPDHILLKMQVESVDISLVESIAADGSIAISNIRSLRPDSQWNLKPVDQVLAGFSGH